MKAVVFTLGCKVNSRESASIITGLREKGFETSDTLEWADLYVINTCAVTAEAEKKSRQAISRALKFNKDAKVVVCGCASQNNPKAFADKGVKVITGAKAKDKLIDYIDSEGIFIEQGNDYYEKYMPAKSSRVREYIKIQDGCNNFCSYCIIPYLRGRSRSRKIENVVAEIEALSPQEAVITGINVSAFNDEGKGLSELLRTFKKFDCRFRFGSLEVCSITKELLDATKELKNFAPHFHLSLQSGSDAVLKSMSRHYTTNEFYEKVKLIREYYPNVAITTDIIVGYSTETEENFNETLEFCDKVGFADIHCFPYSVREGTKGAKLKPLPDNVKKQRLDKLLQKKYKLKNDYLQKYLGKTLTVICEEEIDGYVVGYTENYLRVYLKNANVNAFCKVELTELFRDGALAKIVQ
ncbi:MAG: tRNA (N(6)-L-threonylcarbamoyladenosine(37)-C(2))-methylthiotransferase MtaB [Clostridia bacterium]|nr:tRNA (N(6)-L-threonylcarbamoyladenosine(37)-C(2))-methylthiotransferase MtaB [Clostridia bacterium]